MKGITLAIGVGISLAPGSVHCQAYPTKPVRLIVAFLPGGAADTFGRIIGPPLAEALGRPVVVDNRPSAGTNIDAEVAAKSLPDGYPVPGSASS